MDGLIEGRGRAEMLLRAAECTELLGRRQQERTYLDEARARAYAHAEEIHFEGKIHRGDIGVPPR